MPEENTPCTTIDDRYNEAGLRALIDDMLKKGSAYWQMVSAVQELPALIKPYLEKSTLLHPELSREDAANFLFGQCSLEDETRNGPMWIFSLLFQGNPMKISRNKIDLLIESFADLSTLSTSVAFRENAQKIKGIPRDKYGNLVETKRQALNRTADEIERWCQHNTELISSEDQKKITTELVKYRTSIADFYAFHEKVKDYRDHLYGQLGEEGGLAV